MVKKSLLFFVLLFGLYTIFLRMHPEKWHSDQNQFEQNIAKADRYIYSDTVPQGLILGSSLSERIIEDSIPGIYNLGMSGLSVFDGFHLLSKAKKAPRYVFIETNVIYRPQSDVFSQLYDSKINVFLKDNFSAMREENQPVGVLKHYITKAAKKTANTNSPAARRDVNVSAQVFNELLAAERKEYTHPDTVLIKAEITRLTNNIIKLQKRGIHICFFELPTDTSLEALPLATFIRSSIKRNFSSIEYIPFPANISKTTDGIHMQPSSAIEYTRYFYAYAKNIMKSQP